MSKKIICIDPGHGGQDSGATAFGRTEKADVLRLSLKIREYLLKQNVQVIMTRTSDANITIRERCDFANRQKADYFLSVHRNSGGGKGYEVWVHSHANDDRYNKGREILYAVTAVTDAPNRGVKKGAAGNYADYGVNRLTDMASSLLEVGFVDSKSDNAEFDEKLDRIAEAIAKALCKNVGVKYVINSKPVAPPLPKAVCDAEFDEHIKTGTVYFYTDKTNINKNLQASVKFKTPFKTVPRVTASGNTGDSRGVTASVCKMSKTGFSISFSRSNLGSPATSVDWIAVGE